MYYSLLIPLFLGQEEGVTEWASQQRSLWAQGAWVLWDRSDTKDSVITMYFGMKSSLPSFEVMISNPVHLQPGCYSWGKPPKEKQLHSQLR